MLAFPRNLSLRRSSRLEALQARGEGGPRVVLRDSRVITRRSLAVVRVSGAARLMFTVSVLM